MHVLLSNDDGYYADGLAHLQQVVCEFASITTVAPDRNRSGASNSLTLDRPLVPTLITPNTYAMNGTPTDCVHIGLTALCEQTPDLVVSGINHGANMGDDVLYSGTVAAATEGRFLGLPAIAVSLAFGPQDSHFHYKTAAHVVRQLMDKLANMPLRNDTILNVNVPNVPKEQLAGMMLTRLGKRHKAKPAMKSSDPQGRAIYWIGAVGEEQDAGEGTDFYAIKNGFVSITPLHTDLTDYQQLETSSEWLSS